MRSVRCVAVVLTVVCLRTCPGLAFAEATAQIRNKIAHVASTPQNAFTSHGTRVSVLVCVCVCEIAHVTAAGRHHHHHHRHHQRRHCRCRCVPSAHTHTHLWLPAARRRNGLLGSACVHTHAHTHARTHTQTVAYCAQKHAARQTACGEANDFCL